MIGSLILDEKKEEEVSSATEEENPEEDEDEEENVEEEMDEDDLSPAKLKKLRAVVVTYNNQVRGYETFFILNSTEHKIYPAHKC